MKTPNHVLSENHVYHEPNIVWYDPKTIPAGTFVKPIEMVYVPKHILDKWKSFNSKEEIFIYCSYGMFPVSNKIVREI